MGKKILKNLDPNFLNKLSSIVGHSSKQKNSKSKPSSTSGTKTFKKTFPNAKKTILPPPLPLPLPPPIIKKDEKPVVVKNIEEEVNNDIIRPIQPIIQRVETNKDKVDGNVFVKMMKQHVKMSGMILKHEEKKIDKFITLFLTCFMMNLFMYVFLKII